MLQRREAQPGGELSSGSELVRVGHRGGERRGTDGADTRDRCKPPGDVARTVPGQQLALDLAQPRLEIEYLPSQAHDHLCRQRRYVGHVARSDTLGENQRVRDPTPYLNAELCQQAADHVDELRALLDEQVPCPVKRQRRLLLGALDRDIPHRRTRYRLADRLGIARRRLPTLDVSLHISRRQQTHVVTKLADLAGPIVARPARLNADQTRIEPGKKPDHLRAPKRLTDNNFAFTVDAVNLENVLRQIEADRGNFHDGWLPSLVVA